MKYGYEVYPVNCNGSRYWIAESKALIRKGIKDTKQRTVFGQGNTMDASIQDLEEKERKWIEMAEYCGLKIEEPSKKAIPPSKLTRRKLIVIVIAFLYCLVLGASSAVVDYKMLIGFLASLLLATPAKAITVLRKQYTSMGYMSPLDKYLQYIKVFGNDQETNGITDRIQEIETK